MYFYYCTHGCVCQLDIKENDDDDDDGYCLRTAAYVHVMAFEQSTGHR